MTIQPATGVGRAEVDAALLLLCRMGVTPADLLAGAAPRPAAPMFAEYVPVVAGAVSDASRRAYSTYWNKVIENWGERRLDEPTSSEIKQIGEHLRASAVVRRNGRGGNSAVEKFITALRCLYRHAVADGLIGERDNPAAKVDKPRRLTSTRHAVTDTRIAEINQVAATTGSDPALDTLLLRLHIETACRRGGALALRPADMDSDQCLILLREKGDTTRCVRHCAPLVARGRLAIGENRARNTRLGGAHAAYSPFSTRHGLPGNTRLGAR